MAHAGFLTMTDDNNKAIESLLGRFSLGVKHLSDPGPNAAQLATMVAAALRAPDHGELVPWRFSVVEGEARNRLADLFVQHAQTKGKDEKGLEIERERAVRAPMTVAVIARIDLGHPVVPAHEQWMCIGGAVTNFLNAAHALGFAGKMLCGDKVRARPIAEAFCAPGETLVGWIALGTPTRALSHEDRKSTHQVVDHWLS